MHDMNSLVDDLILIAALIAVAWGIAEAVFGDIT